MNMKDDNYIFRGYLVLKQPQVSLICSGRVTKNVPALAYNEIALNINVKIPSVLFERTIYTANIELPEQQFDQEVNIDLEGLQELIYREKGIRLEISPIPKPEEVE